MLVSSSSKRSKLYPKARDYCILCISSLIIRNFGKFKRYLRLPQKFSLGGCENKFRGGDGTPSHPRSYVPAVGSGMEVSIHVLQYLILALKLFVISVVVGFLFHA